MLYVVATPIGNLGDLSERAVAVLRDVELVLVEDTRVFSRLATRFGIAARWQSLHEHNERTVTPRIVAELRHGRSIALVSDSGTPLISDPGYRLVRACREAQIPVNCVPGPCAAVAALSVAGLPTNRFCFEGFLPPKGEKKRRALVEILARGMTSVVYESPHRIASTLKLLAELAPEREIALAKELTKIHEAVFRGTPTEVLGALVGHERGEFVLLIGPPA